MRIFLSAGEASGDAYGAALVREIKKLGDGDQTPLVRLLGRNLLDPSIRIRDVIDVDSLDIVEYVMQAEDEFGIEIPDVDMRDLLTVGDFVAYLEKKTGKTFSWEPSQTTFEGIGGPKLKAEGVQLYADSSHWGAISIVQAAKVFWKVFMTLHGLKHHLRRGKPGLLIAIDFGYANIRLCRYAKKHGWKVLYFVPPGSWRRDRQGKDLPEIADEIVTPFSWSAEILQGMGASAHWFGHPIKQLIASAGSGDDSEHAAANPSLNEIGASIAVLPGSRKHELEMNLPVIAQAIQGLHEQVEFALAPSVDLAAFKEEWNHLAPGRTDMFTVGDTYGVLKRAKAGIVCSGTATLEASLCRCPMVVLYKLSPAMVREAKLIRMKRPKFIALPNILMDRQIVPEIAGEDVRAEQVRVELDALMRDGAARSKQLADFEELDHVLGPADAITKTADLAIRMLNGTALEQTE